MSREVLQQALAWFEDVDGATDEGVQAPELITAIRAALEQPYPEYDRGFSNGWDKCAARQVTQPDNTSKLYDELRAIIDSGSESFTHADAVQYLKDNLEPLKWTPEDTAYRPGGLAQPELSDYQCCDCKTRLFCGADCHVCGSFSAEDIPQDHSEQVLDMVDWEGVAADQALTIALMKSEQEPVEYQMRMRPTWEVASWSDWKKCSRDSAGDYAKTPKLNDWEYETRKLYASPPKRQPLTDEEIKRLHISIEWGVTGVAFSIALTRAIEAAHGIKASS